MARADGFFLGFYVHTLTTLLGQPRKFFSELPRDFGWQRPMAFLVVSGLFFAGACLVSTLPPHPVLYGTIFLVNAVGMAIISATIGYGIMVMFMGRRERFSRFFSVYALAAGVTLLAAWVPFFIWLTEPWKWWLIGTGMTRSFGFTWLQAMMIIGLSAIVITLFFWSVWPVVSAGK